MASSSGPALVAQGFDAAAGLDTLVVSGGWGTREATRCEATLGFTRTASCEARRTASICTGAFLLAAAGLLDDRSATTHWRLAPEFARAYPRVRLDPDRIFVRDGKFWTSAGISAGIDLALALIADDLGEPIAKQTAQNLVVYHRRPGGQSPFSALLPLDAPGGRFAPLLAWAREHLAEPLPVELLADRAVMSPRNFARAFAAETGMTPAKAIEHLRLEAARAYVEEGSDRSTEWPTSPASATPNACGAPSCAPSASRRERCAEWRGRQRDNLLGPRLSRPHAGETPAVPAQCCSRVARKRRAGQSSIVVRKSQALRAMNTGTPSWSSASAEPLRSRKRSSSARSPSSQRAAS